MRDLSEHLTPGMGRLVRVLLRLQTIYVCFGCLVMGITFFLVVVFRYGFNADLFAYEEWLLIICFWLYFLAAAIGTWEGSHVNADLLDFIILDPGKRRLRMLVITGIELAVTVALLYWSILMIMDELGDYPRLQSTIALQIPFIVPRAAIFVGFLLMGFYSALRFWIMLKLPPSAFAPDGVVQETQGEVMR